jgi:hypothetical protein
MEIQESFEPEEPMHCQRVGCKEELNGLNHFWIEVFKGYNLEIWLCDECATHFRKKIRIIEGE